MFADAGRNGGADCLSTRCQAHWKLLELQRRLVVHHPCHTNRCAKDTKVSQNGYSNNANNVKASCIVVEFVRGRVFTFRFGTMAKGEDFRVPLASKKNPSLNKAMSDLEANILCGRGLMHNLKPASITK
jgi:hypothetical protein